MDRSQSLKIKVCGMREPDNIRELVTLRIDYIGFIFYPRSQRYVPDIDPDLLSKLPAGLKRTGVFVNAAKEDILDKVAGFGLHAVQLHGTESPELCVELKRRGLEVIKAFGVDEDFDFEQLSQYEACIDYFLFDTKTKQHGGSGVTFDWSLLNRYKLDKPYFLSGGLDAENIGEALKINDERFYAVDLNSRFETAPAVKDIDLLALVVEKLKGVPISTIK